MVDQLTLSISGDAASWATIAPGSINIYPDTAAEATIRLAPPRASRPVAGLIELVLDVVSAMDPGASTSQRASIEIEPYDELGVAAEGSTSLSGSTEAVLPIKVRNLGNRAADVALAVSPTPAGSVTLSTTSTTIEPGGEATVWATVRPSRQSPGAAARLHPFTVSVSSRYSPTITIDARMEQSPGPPVVVAKRRRLPIALVALLGAGLVGVVVGGVVLINVLGGATVTPAGPTPTANTTAPPKETTPPPEETTPPPEETTPPPEETTPPPDTPTPVQPLSFGERAAGRWGSASVVSRLLDEGGFPSSNFSGFLDVQLTDPSTLPDFTWWWPATAEPEVLVCEGVLDGDVLTTLDPALDLGRAGAGELTGFPVDALGAEMMIGHLCGVRADVLPDGAITGESFVNTFTAHGSWRIILGGDDVAQPATTLDMIIDDTIDDLRVITTINWVR